jgi:hypothetical protein
VAEVKSNQIRAICTSGARADTIFIDMKIVKLVLVLIILSVLLGLGYYVFGNYSDGYRAGTVIKMSRKGLIFKTFEGELNLGMGIHDGSASVAISNVWSFSVDSKDSACLAGLDAALVSGSRAKLHYREKFIAAPWRGDTKYLVYKVEVGP